MSRPGAVDDRGPVGLTTFDRPEHNGQLVTADELVRVSATDLHGEFATVADTAQLTLSESRRS
jgi:hypothetical protein